jgi:hypothetical protein
LLMVVETVDSGRPAPMAHWRAGFWPRLNSQYGHLEAFKVVAYFADITLPTKTSSTSSGFKPARSTAAVQMLDNWFYYDWQTFYIPLIA